MRFSAARGHSYAGVEEPGELCFCKCKTNELLCLSGRRWKPEQQQTQRQQVPQRQKAKNNSIRRVIMNNSFDLIESDPGNVYKYMEYMTVLDAAHEP